MNYFKEYTSLLLLLSSILFAHAQSSDIKASSTIKLDVVATVNIFNATSTKKDNDLSISFDITNRVGVQPGVKYAVVLISEKDTKQTIADEHVYEDMFTLGEYSSVHKKITYKIPSTLEGDFKVYLSSKNVSGFPFAFTYVDTITLVKNTNIVSPLYIDISSCFLTVQGDETKYAKNQNVDISSEETLESNCTIQNNSNSPLTITPSFITRTRSSFGDIATTTSGDFSSITLSPNEQKIVKTILPKGVTPQNYAVSLSFGEKSNTVVYEYSIQGGSGIIKNIVLDKNYYKKGEYANVSFVWTPPLDSFYKSRKGTASDYVSQQQVSITLLDKDKKACNDTFVEDFTNKDLNIHLKVKITSECFYSTIDIKLLDKVTNMTDTLSFEGSQNTKVEDQKNNSLFENILSIASLLLSLVLLFIINRKRTIVPVAILFLFLSNDSVKADTVTATGQTGSSVVSVTYVIGLNKSTYSIGEGITASSYISYSFEPTANFTMSSTINGSTQNVIPSNSFTAPSSAGSYSAGFTAGGYVYTKTGQCGDCEEVRVDISGSGSISYSVASPPAPTVNIQFSYFNKVKDFFQNNLVEKVLAVTLK